MNATIETTQSIAKKVLMFFARRPSGRVFNVRSLSALGSRQAVDQALSRLVRSGYLKRVGRGLYVRPRIVPGFGEVPPASSAIVEAVVDLEHLKLQVAPGAAAHAFGLITQVPGRRIFYATSSLKPAILKRHGVEVRQTSSRKRMLGAGTTVGTVLQALRFLGPLGVDEVALRKVRMRLSESDRRALTREIDAAPLWMQPHLYAITSTGGEE